MTVVIVEDHELYATGLKLLLEQQGLRILGSAATGKEAIALLATCPPDVLLCDVQLPDMKPEALLKNIRELQPDLPIIYLTMMRGSRAALSLLRYNIQGYVLKNAPVAELMEALQIVAAGGTYFSASVDQLAADVDYRQTITVKEESVTEVLTKREVEILQLICREYSNHQIADMLFISTGTVDTHRKNIIQKLGVKNTVGLVRYAVRQGLIG